MGQRHMLNHPVTTRKHGHVRCTQYIYKGRRTVCTKFFFPIRLSSEFYLMFLLDDFEAKLFIDQSDACDLSLWSEQVVLIKDPDVQILVRILHKSK